MGRNGAKSEVKVVASQTDWDLLLEEQVLIKDVQKVTNKRLCLVPSPPYVQTILGCQDSKFNQFIPFL